MANDLIGRFVVRLFEESYVVLCALEYLNQCHLMHLHIRLQIELSS